VPEPPGRRGVPCLTRNKIPGLAYRFSCTTFLRVCRCFRPTGNNDKAEKLMWQEHV
jgi:hypothetical protein